MHSLHLLRPLLGVAPWLLVLCVIEEVLLRGQGVQTRQQLVGRFGATFPTPTCLVCLPVDAYVGEGAASGWSDSPGG
jgi:hypothetical protein